MPKSSALHSQVSKTLNIHSNCENSASVWGTSVDVGIFEEKNIAGKIWPFPVLVPLGYEGSVRGA